MSKNATLRQTTITGIIWNFMEQLFRRGIQIGTTLILAWFLLPEDFGLMAMITVFFALATSLMDSGFSQALIRKKEVSQVDYSTAFYTNLGLGVLAYVLLFAAAPFIGDFYDEPRLILLVRVVGLVVIINSFQLVQVADLTRKLNFKVQFRVTLPGAVISAVVAVGMAALGFGVWSLAAQMLVSSFAVTAFYWVANDWRPTREFSIDSLNEMFGFGSKLLVSGIINTVFQNLYVIVIGKLFSASIVGYYFFAQQIQRLIVDQLSNSVQKVTYPALATMQDDNVSLKEYYRRIIKVITYFVFPAMIGLMVLAEPIFSFFLKEDWLPAVPYLQLLCLVGLVHPLHTINLNILMVKGRSDLFLYLEVIKKIIMVIILLICINYGIFAIIIGEAIVSFIAYIPNTYFSFKLINYSVLEQLYDFIPNLFIATLMGIIMYLLNFILSFDGFEYLIFVSIFGFVFYVIVNYLLKMQAQSILLKIIKGYIGKGNGHE